MLPDRLGKDDSDKLGEYLDSIREIEIQLSKEGQWLDVPKVKRGDPMPEPKQGMSGDKEIRLMYDLLVAALQTDATRVAIYRQWRPLLPYEADQPTTPRRPGPYTYFRLGDRG